MPAAAQSLLLHQLPARCFSLVGVAHPIIDGAARHAAEQSSAIQHPTARDRRTLALRSPVLTPPI
jgi:hypothetical protein